MESTLLSKVQELFIFMQSRPITEQMATFLSEHFFPSGEIAGVTVSRLQNTGEIECEIATELGYSESLIRQETIIIYRKLGVSGRKDLVPEMQE